MTPYVYVPSEMNMEVEGVSRERIEMEGNTLIYSHFWRMQIVRQIGNNNLLGNVIHALKK